MTNNCTLVYNEYIRVSVHIASMLYYFSSINNIGVAIQQRFLPPLVVGMTSMTYKL